MSQFTHPKGVLLVGSLPVPSNEDAFKLSCQTLPGRLASIPDGETGNRHKWVGWQCDVFPQETLKFNSATMLSRRHDRSGIPLPNGHTGVFTQDDVKPSLYDQVTKDSYQKFKELRNQGIIPPGVRFQVSLPTPQASIQAHLRPEFQAPLEPFYEKRIYDAIDSIVEEIPPEDLSLQLDLCLEVTSLEYERGRLKNDFFKPYFYPTYEGVLECIQRMADHIPDNVPLGIHPCYGDLNHNPLSFSPPSRPAAFEYNGMTHRPDPKELNSYTSNRPPFNSPGGTGAPGYRNSQYRPEPQQPPNNHSANNTPIITPRIPIESEYDDAQDRPGPGGFHHRHASNHSTLRPPKRPAAGPVDDVPNRKVKGNPKRPKPGPRPKNKGPKSPGRSNAVPGKPSNAANWPDRRLARPQQKARKQQN